MLRDHNLAARTDVSPSWTCDFCLGPSIAFDLSASSVQSALRNRTYNLSVKSGIVRLGKPMISKGYGGAKRTIWSLFGRQFGEKFGEVLLLN